MPSGPLVSIVLVSTVAAIETILRVETISLLFPMGTIMPDGSRKRRFSDNAARRAYYADSRCRRYAARVWAGKTIPFLQSIR